MGAGSAQCSVPGIGLPSFGAQRCRIPGATTSQCSFIARRSDDEDGAVPPEPGGPMEVPGRESRMATVSLKRNGPLLQTVSRWNLHRRWCSYFWDRTLRCKQEQGRQPGPWTAPGLSPAFSPIAIRLKNEAKPSCGGCGPPSSRREPAIPPGRCILEDPTHRSGEAVPTLPAISSCRERRARCPGA